jgi:hypothetical protein
VETQTRSFLGDKAWLISELVHSSNASCLEWYMHLDGNYAFTLDQFINLTVYQVDNANKMNLLWTLNVN